MSSAYGMVGGFSPALAVVAHGTSVQFHNQDGFNHTASSVAGTSFPAKSPIGFGSLTQSGTDVARAGWSTGLLTAGAFSVSFTTSAAGTFLYGCFYHYPDGMRGVIIVQ
jgi:plastocyanin